MKIILFPIAFIITLLLQITISELISIHGVRPDFVLIMLVYIALSESRATATIVGCLFGLMEDIGSTDLYGVSALTNSITIFMISSIKGYFEFRNLYEQIIIMAIASLTKLILTFSIISLRSPLLFWRSVFIVALPSTLYTIVLGFIIYALIPRTHWQTFKKSTIRN